MHVDATLRILGYIGDEAALPIRKACTSGLFHRKEITRLVMALLKANSDGIQASEIALAISRDKGWETDDKRFQVSMTDKVGRTLSRLKKMGHASFESCEAGYVWRLT